MTRNIFAAGWLLALAIVGVTPVSAQTTAFTYQGRLEAAGSPVSGIYDLRFAIYDSAGGGGQQGNALTNVATPVSNGQFTVTLDFGNQFSGADRWLEIAVRTNGGGAFASLSPRQFITPTPYAIRAAHFSGPVNTAQLTGTIAPANIAPESITGPMLAHGTVGSAQLAAGSVNTSALADNAVTADKLATYTRLLGRTDLVRSPAQTQAEFGAAVAGVGTDRVLVGVPKDDLLGSNAGVAHLYDLTGELLAVFAPPAPSANGEFGTAVAVVGPDRVLVGAPNYDLGATDAGAAYLFNLSGGLVRTFTNPAPASLDVFGRAVAAVGNDRVLIGAPFKDLGNNNAGAAYLFDLNGNLLVTYTNPIPTAFANFGTSLTAVGGNRVLIGTQGGRAYLFDLAGNLLVTYTNPLESAAGQFGYAVAAIGTERVVVGAYLSDLGATAAGAAFLFDLAGNHLTTFTNPVPGVSDNFGIAVTGVGNSRVLIGSFNDTPVANAGTAYLFDLAGNLRQTFTNPAPALNDYFGNAVAALGKDRVIVGAYLDDAGATDAGSVHVFDLTDVAPGFVTEKILPGSITTASLANGAVTAAKIGGTLNAGQLPGGGNWTLSSSLNLDNGTLFIDSFNKRVGIGTMSPTVALDVAGRILASSSGPTIQGTKTGTGTFPGVAGITESTSADASGVRGNVTATNAGARSAGVLGRNFGTGANGYGVRGNHDGSGYGVYGETVSGRGVSGRATATSGVNFGVYGQSDSTNGIGVYGSNEKTSGINYGVYGITASRDGSGVYGLNTATNFSLLTGKAPAGVTGLTAYRGGVGVRGEAIADSDGSGHGVLGTTRVWGGDGVRGEYRSATTFPGYGAAVAGYNYTAGGYAGYFVGRPTYCDEIYAFRLGVRRTPVSNALEVEGSASKSSSGSWLANSDARIKQEVETVTDALDTLNRVRLVSFRYEDDYRAQHSVLPDRRYLNVIAQEFAEVFPDHVQSSGEKLPDGSEILQVDIHPLTIYSAAAIQELSHKLEQKETELAALQQRLAALERLVFQLQRKGE